jgi:hypothetical protein
MKYLIWFVSVIISYGILEDGGVESVLLTILAVSNIAVFVFYVVTLMIYHRES